MAAVPSGRESMSTEALTSELLRPTQQKHGWELALAVPAETVGPATWRARVSGLDAGRLELANTRKLAAQTFGSLNESAEMGASRALLHVDNDVLHLRPRLVDNLD